MIPMNIRTTLRFLLPYIPLAAIWMLLLAGNNLWAFIAFHLISRCTYFLYVSLTLRAREQTCLQGGPQSDPDAFERFRRRASLILNNDAVSFLLLVVGTTDTLVTTLPVAVRIIIALVLIILGAGIKLWTLKILGSGGYYWEDFFTPPTRERLQLSGPYRLIRNPMYTVGYAHAYGLALLLGSWPGLLAAVFDQTMILILNAWVEHPHCRRIYGIGKPRPQTLSILPSPEEFGERPGT